MSIYGRILSPVYMDIAWEMIFNKIPPPRGPPTLTTTDDQGTADPKIASAERTDGSLVHDKIRFYLRTDTSYGRFYMFDLVRC